MPRDNVPVVEYRTRITCYLPVTAPDELKVVYELIEHLESQRRKPFGLLGFTRSAFAPPVYAGYWRSSPKAKLVQEKVVVFTIDHDADIEEGLVLQEASKIKSFIQFSYKMHTGFEQEEIWMVAQPIVRVI